MLTPWVQSNATKTDPLIAENPGKSLDELVSLKIINADQKAQRLGIPELEEKSQQLIKQIEMLEEIEKEFKVKLAEQEKILTEQFEKEKAALVAELEKKVETESSKSLNSSLLLLSQFLRLAAARRAEDAETVEDEGQALEGVLLQVYSGDDNAVATMLKLVHGSDEQTISTSSETLQTTCMFTVHLKPDPHLLIIRSCSGQATSHCPRAAAASERRARGC